MQNRLLRWTFLGFLAPFLIWTGSLACSGQSTAILRFPAIVTIDSAQNRVFVLDNQDNGLYLVDAIELLILGEQPLLGPGQDNQDPQDTSSNEDQDIDGDGEVEPDEIDETAQLLPLFPSNAAVADLGGGVSRLFVIGGNGTGPMNQVVVLDYDETNGIRNAPFSPIPVTGNPTDALVGIAVVPTLGLVFVTDSTNAELHAFDIQNGVEVAGSPIALPGMPGRVQFDANLGQVVVSNLTMTQVNYVDPANLATPPVAIEVGIPSRDGASVTNASGTALFVSGNLSNTARVFRVNLANPAATTQIFELLPPAPTGPPPSDNFLTGTLNQVRAGIRTDGVIAAFYTQSSGDLLALELSADLATITPVLVTVGAVSGEGIDLFLNSSGQVASVFFASPGVGVVTVVDPLTNLFTSQVD